jgi:hypothetical protein
MQVTPRLLDLAAWTFGERADRAHTDHDLARAGGRADVGGNLDPAHREADVNAPSPGSLIPGYAQNFWIGA